MRCWGVMLCVAGMVLWLGLGMAENGAAETTSYASDNKVGRIGFPELTVADEFQLAGFTMDQLETAFAQICY